MVKNVENCSKSLIINIYVEYYAFLAVFYVFHHVNFFFFLNSKSLEHLKGLCPIRVMSNFDYLDPER